ncbi:hypothetical protein [Pseudomonas rhodesiae]|uniref:Uncharacterized protein n=1 Tax=Pseudomonas rhodesiae TaxID=76760 RepID=A0AAE8HAI6_9PSED|nr:hypothetical protein [Pseudomonas rhodesiae]TWR53523.1 hypothetical protein FIV35_17540 [Pseudomonas rhodesiae]SDU97489.1 hypothetical protein SAMN04490209_1371 [Pseudomonas rhodesiae]
MSEVERYWIAPSRLVQEGWHQDDTCVVKDWAYDRVVAERDALQQRLTAADERADVLEGLLREVQKSARKQDWANGYPTLFASVDAALKPAEGVGDDTTLEEDREDFKKVFVRINTKQGQSISLADMIARYEKKP